MIGSNLSPQAQVTNKKVIYKGEDYTAIYQPVSHFVEQVVSGKKPPTDDVYEIYRAAERIRDSFSKSDRLIASLFVEDEVYSDIVPHMIDVAIVSAKIGIGLNLNTKNLRDLIVCALLHDIGMLFIPEEILFKKGELSNSEINSIKQHPQYGLDALKDIADLNPIVSTVVYQEQERIDGSGYPLGLTDEKIHEFAKIIGLSDTYAAMIKKRPYRDRKLPFEIVKEIIRTERNHFPEYLIRTMIDELSIFPTGLYVKLNSGEIGKVKSTNKLAPFRPVVEIIKDAFGRTSKDGKEYNLMKESLLYIEEAFFSLD